MNRFAIKVTPLLVLSLALLVLGGCGLLDAFFLKPAGPDGVETGPSTAETVGESLRILIPGWGTLVSLILGGAGTLYTAIRGKKRESLMPALVLDIIKAVMSAKDGKLDYDALYANLQNASTLIANKDKFVALVDAIKASVAKELADGFQPEDLARIANDVQDEVDAIGKIPAPGVPSAPAAPVAPAPAPTNPQ